MTTFNGPIERLWNITPGQLNNKQSGFGAPTYVDGVDVTPFYGKDDSGDVHQYATVDYVNSVVPSGGGSTATGGVFYAATAEQYKFILENYQYPYVIVTRKLVFDSRTTINLLTPYTTDFEVCGHVTIVGGQITVTGSGVTLTYDGGFDGNRRSVPFIDVQTPHIANDFAIIDVDNFNYVCSTGDVIRFNHVILESGTSMTSDGGSVYVENYDGAYNALASSIRIQSIDAPYIDSFLTKVAPKNGRPCRFNNVHGYNGTEIPKVVFSSTGRHTIVNDSESSYEDGSIFFRLFNAYYEGSNVYKRLVSGYAAREYHRIAGSSTLEVIDRSTATAAAGTAITWVNKRKLLW